MVLTPVRRQDTAVVNELAAFKEIAQAVHTVIVETVGIKRCLAVIEHHVISGTGQLVVTVVIGIVTEQRQGVTLIHLHMTESLEGIAGFEEIGAVTIKAGSHVVEMHMSAQDLCVTVLILVIAQLVSMDQIDTLVCHLGLAGPFLPDRRHGLNHTKATQAQDNEYKCPMPVK